jgi:amino acid transporter
LPLRQVILTRTSHQVATFVGADASVHLAEEVANAAVNIPRAICGSMLINGMVGFAMMLTLLFCIGDVDSVLDTETGYPFIQIFYSESAPFHLPFPLDSFSNSPA